MHGFYQRHFTDLLNHGGRELVISELEGYISSFTIADAVVSVVTEAIAKALGITEAHLDLELERLMKNATSSKPPSV